VFKLPTKLDFGCKHSIPSYTKRIFKYGVELPKYRTNQDSVIYRPLLYSLFKSDCNICIWGIRTV